MITPSQMPLPFSAVPQQFAAPIGELCLNFQRIEDELDELRQELDGSDQFSEFIYTEPFSRKLSTVKKLCQSRVGKQDWLASLFKRMEELKDYRNDIMHARIRGGIKPGNIVLATNRRHNRNELYEIHIDELIGYVDRAILIVIAFEARRMGDENWIEPINYWDTPDQYFSKVDELDDI